jgi:hypothetical protein
MRILQMSSKSAIQKGIECQDGWLSQIPADDHYRAASTILDVAGEGTLKVSERTPVEFGGSGDFSNLLPVCESIDIVNTTTTRTLNDAPTE